MSYSNGFTFFQGKFIKSTAEGDKCKKRRHSSFGNDVTKRVYFQIKTPSHIPILPMIMCTHRVGSSENSMTCSLTCMLTNMENFMLFNMHVTQHAIWFI